MEKAETFHEIFMSHLRKTGDFSGETTPNFDHTLSEKPVLRHKVLHFSNPVGVKSYQSRHSGTKTREESKKRQFSSESASTEPQKTRRLAADSGTTKEPAQPKITMKHLNSPELLAAASIVTGYLGDTGFLPRTEKELKTAYRHMLLNEHPDHGGDPEDFHQTLEAFRMVLDVARNLKAD